MSTKRINGILFEKMLKNGLANLQRAEKTLNSLNVFPVADGDTGSNLRLTLENGLRNAKACETVGAYLRELNEGLLMGARGNSGVILSQIFKGISLHLARCSAANVGDMRNAFVKGYKTAYQAVVDPVEGTILTVAREGIENIRPYIDRNTTIEALFTMYVAEMKKSLARTPQLLPVLKASGVVDSGALGYITVMEGMSKYLNGDVLELDAPAVQSAESSGSMPAALDVFNENSSFEDGYCMEFVLQLMRSASYAQDFDLEVFIRDMRPLGTSIAVSREKSRVKVHIHTKDPGWIIKLAQRYGEFLTFKLENMQVQHNEHALRQQEQDRGPRKALSIVAVANGPGLKEQFRQLGCDCVLDGGPTMNTPSSEFARAFETHRAEHIVVLPNSKNVIGAAKQAAELSKQKNIHVLPTRSVAEGYFALSMDVGNLQQTEKRISNMEKGLDGVTTLAVAPAEKAYAEADVTCQPGDYIAILDDHMVFAAPTPEAAFLGGLGKVKDLEEKETCVIFAGEAAAEACQQALEEGLEDNYPDLEVTFAPGGQPTWLWVCGII